MLLRNRSECWPSTFNIGQALRSASVRLAATAMTLRVLMRWRKARSKKEKEKQRTENKKKEGNSVCSWERLTTSSVCVAYIAQDRVTQLVRGGLLLTCRPAYVPVAPLSSLFSFVTSLAHQPHLLLISYITRKRNT